MKKTLKAAVALSVLTAPAYAANLENPLYMPKQGAVYSKTSVGVMYKKADHSAAQQQKGHAGATEFPIWRAHEELGYGILDDLELYGKFGYTHDGDIDRKGMHLGRAGLKYRALTTEGGFVWDMFADMHFGGVSAMSGSYAADGFTYDNYSNGRWGFHLGTQFGQTWDKFSVAAFAELLHTFGNDNNEIDISSVAKIYNGMGGKLPSEISVDLASTTEFNAGFKAFYEINDTWSIGGGFTWKRHEDNGVEGLATDIDMTNPVNADLVSNLLKQTKDMNDGFEEYIVSLSVANQITDMMQVAVYGEYTFDNSHSGSQNGTDVKAELGVRLNVEF